MYGLSTYIEIAVLIYNIFVNSCMEFYVMLDLCQHINMYVCMRYFM